MALLLEDHIKIVLVILINSVYRKEIVDNRKIKIPCITIKNDISLLKVKLQLSTSLLVIIIDNRTQGINLLCRKLVSNYFQFGIKQSFL
jgi:hypothetical protein